MAGKKSVNWGTILGIGLPTSVGLGFVGLLGAFFVSEVARINDRSENYREITERPQFGNLATLPGDTDYYLISGSDQVRTGQGDFSYTFNFLAQHVVIPYDKNLTVIDFKNFSNPSMIEDVHAKACQVALNFMTVADQYIADKDNEEAESLVKNDLTTAKAFTTDHCKPRP